MKKIIALIVAVVMMFAIVAVPASAAVTDTAQAVADNFNAGDYLAVIDGVFTLVQEIIAEIHELVGGIMGVLGEECAFCEQIHVVEIAPAA